MRVLEAFSYIDVFFMLFSLLCTIICALKNNSKFFVIPAAIHEGFLIIELFIVYLYNYTSFMFVGIIIRLIIISFILDLAFDSYKNEQQLESS